MSKLQLRYSNVGDVIIVDGYDNKVVLILKIYDKHIILQYDQKRDILKEVVRRCNCHDDLLAACEAFAKGWNHFCKCVNFGDSALDADAIRWMNEAPGQIGIAIAKAKEAL